MNHARAAERARAAGGTGGGGGAAVCYVCRVTQSRGDGGGDAARFAQKEQFMNMNSVPRFVNEASPLVP